MAVDNIDSLRKTYELLYDRGASLYKEAVHGELLTSPEKLAELECVLFGQGNLLELLDDAENALRRSLRQSQEEVA